MNGEKERERMLLRIIHAYAQQVCQRYAEVVGKTIQFGKCQRAFSPFDT